MWMGTDGVGGWGVGFGFQKKYKLANLQFLKNL